MHISCQQLLIDEWTIAVYPFLEGVIVVDYLIDHLPALANVQMIEQHFMTGSIKRMIEEKSTILYLTDLINKETLYLLYLLSNQRLYWVFIDRPSFLV